MRFLKFGGNRKFFARDFRNAYQFRPDIAPPRQKFQGYVNFVINRDVGELGNTVDGKNFRTRISSLIKTATLPDVGFKTETKNKYNRKKIVQTGLEFGPVSFTVHDTIQNEWLTLFMRYYSHLYMNPRNKFSGDDRDPVAFFRSSNQYSESKHGVQPSTNQAYDSDAFGFNVSETPYFFERIDFILYHGNKGVQYSVTNPVMNRIRFSEIDYSSSEIMDFQMEFDFENFTTSNKLNFDLTETDLERFETISKAENLPGFASGTRKPVALENPVDLKVTGDSTEQRARAFQALSRVNEVIDDGSDTNLVETYTGEPVLGGEGSDKGWLNGFLEDNPFGRIVDRAIGAKINGQDPEIAGQDALKDELINLVNVNRWTNKGS
jgi:hypothetical protein